jgi:dihydrofolate reductase
VIGGVRLFEEAMPLATRLYVTWIPGTPQGDTVLHFDEARFRVESERVSPAGLRYVEMVPR